MDFNQLKHLVRQLKGPCHDNIRYDLGKIFDGRYDGLLISDRSCSGHIKGCKNNSRVCDVLRAYILHASLTHKAIVYELISTYHKKDLTPLYLTS